MSRLRAPLFVPGGRVVVSPPRIPPVQRGPNARGPSAVWFVDVVGLLAAFFSKPRLARALFSR
eukprot:6611781-Lingulodinium_polyedra.AAC.1